MFSGTKQCCFNFVRCLCQQADSFIDAKDHKVIQDEVARIAQLHLAEQLAVLAKDVVTASCDALSFSSLSPGTE